VLLARSVLLHIKYTLDKMFSENVEKESSLVKFCCLLIVVLYVIYITKRAWVGVNVLLSSRMAFRLFHTAVDGLHEVSFLMFLWHVAVVVLWSCCRAGVPCLVSTCCPWSPTNTEEKSLY
jgi:hypothetical protein